MRSLLCGILVAITACDNSALDNPSSTGTLTGTISASTGTALSNVSVTARPELGSNQTATTNGNGQYTIDNIPFGPGSITVASTPVGCESGGTSYSMPGSFGTVTVNITIQCGITTGTVTGIITSTQGGRIPGATVTITPSGGQPLAPVTTDQNGIYSDASVLASPSSGTITISGLPTGCTTPAPVAYSGLTILGTVTANAVVSCQTSATAVGLWTGGQYLLTAAQLAQSGSPIPTDSCPGALSTISGGLGPEAFDASGNLWTARSTSIVMWSASQLAGACSPATPTITIPLGMNVYSVSAMAFDPRGVL